MAPNPEVDNINGLAITVVVLMGLSLLSYVYINNKRPSGRDDPCRAVPTAATLNPAPEGWFKVEALGYSVEVPGPLRPRVDKPDSLLTLIGSLTVSTCEAAPKKAEATEIFREALEFEVGVFDNQEVEDVEDVEIPRQGHPGIRYHVKADPVPARGDRPATPAIEQFGLSIIANHRVYALACTVGAGITKLTCDRYLGSFTIV